MAVAAVVAAAVIAYMVLRPDSGVARVKGMIAWPDDCADVATTDVMADWPHATVEVVIECEYLGPSLRYARFPSRADMRRDLLAAPPADRVCVADAEIVDDGLFDLPGQFAALCHRLGGDIVDGVSRLPEIYPEDATIAATDRAVDARLRRDRAAEREALMRYFSG